VKPSKQSSLYAFCYSGARLLQPVGFRNDAEETISATTEFRLCEAAQLLKQSSSFVTAATLDYRVALLLAMTAKKSSSCRVVSCNAGEEAVKTQKQSSARVVLAAGLLCSHHL